MEIKEISHLCLPIILVRHPWSHSICARCAAAFFTVVTFKYPGYLIIVITLSPKFQQQVGLSAAQPQIKPNKWPEMADVWLLQVKGAMPERRCCKPELNFCPQERADLFFCQPSFSAKKAGDDCAQLGQQSWSRGGWCGEQRERQADTERVAVWGVCVVLDQALFSFLSLCTLPTFTRREASRQQARSKMGHPCFAAVILNMTSGTAHLFIWSSVHSLLLYLMMSAGRKQKSFWKLINLLLV